MTIKWVNNNIWRGPSPQSPDDWRALTALGIKVCLDLETGANLLRDGDPLAEANKGDFYGIRVYSHPLGEILPPTVNELETAKWMLNNKEPIYVHCKAGVDRTGMVIAYYRIHTQGWPKAKAIAEMKAMGMHPWYYGWAWSL